jgi:hypothetical protein
MPNISVLDLKPVGRFADGSPIYRFSVGFPTRGVQEVGPAFATPQEAYAHGGVELRKYEAADPMGNMGAVLGVTEVEGGGFRAVIVTYHSNT